MFGQNKIFALRKKNWIPSKLNVNSLSLSLHTHVYGHSRSIYLLYLFVDCVVSKFSLLPPFVVVLMTYESLLSVSSSKCVLVQKGKAVASAVRLAISQSVSTVSLLSLSLSSSCYGFSLSSPSSSLLLLFYVCVQTGQISVKAAADAQALAKEALGCKNGTTTPSFSFYLLSLSLIFSSLPLVLKCVNSVLTHTLSFLPFLLGTKS